MQLNLKVSHQILLCLSLPLLFQILFIAALTVNLSELDRLYRHEVHNRNIMTELNRVLAQFLTIAGNQAIYQVTKNKIHGNTLDRDMAEVEVERLTLHNMIAEDQGQIKTLYVFDEVFKALHDSFVQGAKAVASQDKVDAAVAYTRIFHLVNRAKALSNEALGELEEDHKQSESAKRQASDRVIAIVGGGMLFNLSLLIGLLVFLNNIATRRFEHLNNNIVALASERTLAPTLTGKDDLAKLDALLHQVAIIIQESRRKENAVIDNAVDIICSLDKQGKISSINPACLKLWQMSEDQLIGKPLISLIDEGERHTLAARLQEIIEGQREGNFEATIKTGKGSRISMQWNTQWSSEMNNLFCVAHDITERKEAERLKQEVLAMVSHDLRSPLTSMQLTLNLLSSGAFGQLTEKGRDRVGRAEDSITNLIAMISDLLDLEKLSSGLFELEKSEVAAGKLVNDSCELLRDLSGRKKIELLTVVDDFTLTADATRLVRVLTNLIANAVKFAPENSKVVIEARRKGTTAIFSVADSGPGIKAEDRTSVFERYKQLKSQDSSEAQGSGLGLPICKAIVEAHQGEIGVESEIGKGSRFWFKLN